MATLSKGIESMNIVVIMNLAGFLLNFSSCENGVDDERKLPRQGDSGKGELLTVDVGPILRQSLTSAEGFFDNLLSLTLCEKLIRGQVPE